MMSMFSSHKHQLLLWNYIGRTLPNLRPFLRAWVKRRHVANGPKAITGGSESEESCLERASDMPSALLDHWVIFLRVKENMDHL